MDFGLLPVEVDSGLMYIGPGAGPMLAAAAGLGGVLTAIDSGAVGFGTFVAVVPVVPTTRGAGVLTPLGEYTGLGGNRGNSTAARHRCALGVLVRS